MGDEFRRAGIDFGLPSGDFLIVGALRRAPEVGQEVHCQPSLILLGKLVHNGQHICQRFHGPTLRTAWSDVNFWKGRVAKAIRALHATLIPPPGFRRRIAPFFAPANWKILMLVSRNPAVGTLPTVPDDPPSAILSSLRIRRIFTP